MVHIQEREVEFSFSRSGGPGGQNVNKVNSKVTLFFPVEESDLKDSQKEILLDKSSRLTKDGSIVISCGNSRSQHKNRQTCLERLNQHVNDLLKPVKKRKKTRVPRRAKERRLKNKKHRSEKKKLRKKIPRHKPF